jgi:hypothetical protein
VLDPEVWLAVLDPATEESCAELVPESVDDEVLDIMSPSIVLLSELENVEVDSVFEASVDERVDEASIVDEVLDELLYETEKPVKLVTNCRTSRTWTSTCFLTCALTCGVETPCAVRLSSTIGPVQLLSTFKGPSAPNT